MTEIIRELSAIFFSRQSNRQSLITVTAVESRERGGKAIILITVLPEDQEESALAFARRRLTDLRQYILENSRLGRVPFLKVMIDSGEKNRQKIDEIERKL